MVSQTHLLVWYLKLTLWNGISKSPYGMVSQTHLMEWYLQLLTGLVDVEYGELVDVGYDGPLHPGLVLLQAVLN